LTLPASIRINAQFPFPSLVQATGPVTITKSKGIWTVGFQIANLASLPAGFNPANALVLVYNTLTQTFQQTTIAGLLLASTVTPTTVSFAQSPYAVLPTDTFLLVDPSGGPIEIDLPASALRSGAYLSIKDSTGNAQTNNITIKPSGSETADSYTNSAPLKINSKFGGFKLAPRTLGYAIAP
jgi:hypothetical protein